MLVPAAALSLHPQCNPHNRLISTAKVYIFFETTKKQFQKFLQM